MNETQAYPYLTSRHIYRFSFILRLCTVDAKMIAWLLLEFCVDEMHPSSFLTALPPFAIAFPLLHVPQLAYVPYIKASKLQPDEATSDPKARAHARWVVLRQWISVASKAGKRLPYCTPLSKVVPAASNIIYADNCARSNLMMMPSLFQ